MFIKNTANHFFLFFLFEVQFPVDSLKTDFHTLKSERAGGKNNVNDVKRNDKSLGGHVLKTVKSTHVQV